MADEAKISGQYVKFDGKKYIAIHDIQGGIKKGDVIKGFGSREIDKQQPIDNDFNLVRTGDNSWRIKR